MNANMIAKTERIAELLEQVHAGSNELNTSALRELLALSGHSNAIDWSITANGLKEYLHRLFSHAHTRIATQHERQNKQLLQKINDETDAEREVH